MKNLFTAAALAAGLCLAGAGPEARAEFITYSTVGTFGGGDLAGTNVYLDAANGIQITFNGIVSNSVTAPPASQVSFGTFDTAGTTAASLQGVASSFTLDIFQTAPVAGGPLTFVGSLSGQLAIDNSQAFILFEGPLSGAIGSIVYTIIEADEGVLGRANLVPPSVGGISSVEGTIVPEPSSWALLGLGLTGVAAFGRRRIKASLAV